MFIQERLQALIHQLEVGFGARLIRWLLLVVAVATLTLLYDTRAYHSFDSPESMDAAQVARNLSEGHGFTTEYIRPFSLFLLQRHYYAQHPSVSFPSNSVEAAQIYNAHPDLANAPLYPVALAGLMKTWTPQWKVELHKPFWSEGGSFRRYMPEFRIAIMNQVLLLAVVALTFLVTRKIFDGMAAWLAAGLTLGSDVLWKFSVSGLPTMLMMVILLILVWCIIQMLEVARGEEGLLRPESLILTGEAENAGKTMENDPARQKTLRALHRRQLMLAAVAGLMVGLGMLTRYSFGWLIVPVVVFLAIFGGLRRTGLAVVAVMVFALVVSPWIGRNLSVSGTLFGTAGFAAAEGTGGFSGTRLMQSLNPDLTSAYWISPYGHKLLNNLGLILQGDVFQLGGGWMGILFFAGLLLGLRNLAARRLRYFTLMCLGVFIIVEALGRTQLSYITPEYNSENLLVLLTPLVVIFGVGFFLTLLGQMNVPSIQWRIGVVVLLAALIWQPLVATLVNRTQTISYPPYYPPDVQKICSWMQPTELMMSDIPWAVAWYGDRQCVMTTINSRYEFSSLNDMYRPVNALYLTLNTLNGKLFTECMQGGVESWGHFVYRTLAANELPPGFPLRHFPLEALLSGMYLTDRQRW